MKKGFTLIELLAVIVILAIIALIAAPIVINIIEDTKESSTLRSGEFYLAAVDTSIMNYKMNGNQKYVPKSCLILQNGNILCDEEITLEVEIDGEKPDGGTIVFTKGKITSSELIYKTTIIRNNSSGELEQADKKVDLSNTKVVYFDVVKGTSCKESEYNVLNSKTGYNGVDNKTNGQNSCLKFYILNDNGGSNVNLLLDHNTTARIAWNSFGSNNDPSDVLFQLMSDTQNWNGTITPSSYSIGGYTIDYSAYKARLVTAEEIAQVVDNSTWNESVKSSSFYFDSKKNTKLETCTYGNTTGCKYGWLYDRTNTICKSTGCLNNSDIDTAGFWTSTYKSINSVEPEQVEMCNGSASYGVSYKGRLGYACVNNSEHYGVRPVITVLRSSI